jgi:hypothetical protein
MVFPLHVRKGRCEGFHLKQEDAHSQYLHIQFSFYEKNETKVNNMKYRFTMFLLILEMFQVQLILIKNTNINLFAVGTWALPRFKPAVTISNERSTLKC